MTDERLAEIEETKCVRFPDGSKIMSGSTQITDELLQALKAEKIISAELESRIDAVKACERFWSGRWLVVRWRDVLAALKEQAE
jgi:hypothetical protein